MSRRVAVFTGTRAEYGLLYWLMKEIQTHPDLELLTIVSAMHLAPEFGETWRVIEQDGFNIDAKIEMLLASDSSVGVAKSMGVGVLGFADALDRLKPDLLVILGDRFEALAIAQVATVMKIPIAHIHGGEVTEGAYDDAIRHSISKMSWLHFTSTEDHRRRVIQLGEQPDRVFNVGAVGLDHVARSARMSLQEISDSLNFKLQQPFFVATYHPVTLADDDGVQSFQNLLNAFDQFPQHQIILTFPNADNGGRALIDLLQKYAAKNSQRVCAIPSLGFKRYLSCVALSDAVIGNSSSGIIEVPAFGVPTVNIGTRQQGRMASDSVFHCGIEQQQIAETIKKAISPQGKLLSKNATNPYGQGSAAQKIIEQIAVANLSGLKKFFDINF